MKCCISRPSEYGNTSLCRSVTVGANFLQGGKEADFLWLSLRATQIANNEEPFVGRAPCTPRRQAEHTQNVQGILLICLFFHLVWKKGLRNLKTIDTVQQDRRWGHQGTGSCNETWKGLLCVPLCCSNILHTAWEWYSWNRTHVCPQSPCYFFFNCGKILHIIKFAIFTTVRYTIQWR